MNCVDSAGPGKPNSQRYVFLQSGNRVNSTLEQTVIGQAEIEENGLSVETNSIKRADALRTMIESKLGNKLRHRAREHSDPLSPLAQTGNEEESEDLPDDIPAELATQAILAYKRKHYPAWIDRPVPALSGKTPRQAVRTKEGKAQVDLLLKDIENRESRLPEEQRYDISEIRTRLGLEMQWENGESLGRRGFDPRISRAKKSIPPDFSRISGGGLSPERRDKSKEGEEEEGKPSKRTGANYSIVNLPAAAYNLHYLQSGHIPPDGNPFDKYPRRCSDAP